MSHALALSTAAPVSVLYGGAHLFRADSARKLGALALRTFDRYAGGPPAFAQAVGAPAELAEAVHTHTRSILAAGAVHDQRIDFEDGYGVRPDAEEDADATRAAQEMSAGLSQGSLAPWVGIRIKPLGGPSRGRALRTLSTFLRNLSSGLPPRFVVTLPKVQAPSDLTELADALSALEAELGVPLGAMGIEGMVETPAALRDAEGRSPLRAFAAAAQGRLRSVHLGAYDLTAAAGVFAADQTLDHPLNELARLELVLAFAGTSVRVSDGATTTLPIPPHRGDAIDSAAEAENTAVVHSAWSLHARHIHHAMRLGIHQGWDLHPAQLPARWGATYAHLLRDLPQSRTRLANFLTRAAQASRVGSVFDDAATGQGLLNAFAHAHALGAVSDADLSALGVTAEALAARDFAAIVSAQRA